MADLFAQKAPGIMMKLRHDFGITIEEAAAVLGNIGAECGGFQFLQEIKPLVPGSAGGYGWCQWTGSRRRQFEAYCARNGFQPHSDKANYGWLFVELKGLQAGTDVGASRAIAAVKRADSLYNKVVAFETNFERAHPNYKHYPARLRWAQRALAAYQGLSGPPPDIAPVPPKRPPRGSGAAAGAGAAGAAAAAAAGFTDGWIFHFLVFAAIAGAGTGAFIYVRKNRGRLHGFILKRMENSSGKRRAVLGFIGRLIVRD